MAFAAPTRTEMGATVLRALRDPSASVFPTTTVDDFIAQAMADLSAYRPKEAREISVWPLPTDIVPFTDFTSVFKVELHAQNLNGDYIRTVIVPYGDSNSSENRAGWDFFAGALYLPDFWVTRLNANTQNQPSELWVFGYQDRDIPTGDDDILDLTDATDYNCVLNHCKSLGFELLTHDRALYQQWLAATNNTDVSPTQLAGMSSFAEQTYQRTKSRNTKIRRMPSGDYLIAH